VLAECEPVYEVIDGWDEDISGIADYDRFPANVKAYLKRIEDLSEVPVRIVSVGPQRDQTIVLENPFHI
jgi:adenylosuccinate synthase